MTNAGLAKAVAWKCFVKRSQTENMLKVILAQVFSCEFYNIFDKLFYRTSSKGWLCPRNYMKASYQEQIASVPNCTEGRGGSLYSFGEKLPPRESSYMSVTKKDSPHNANFSNLPDPPPFPSPLLLSAVE